MGGFGRAEVQGNLVGDANAVTFKGNHLLGVVGYDADVFQAKINQDLRADAAFVLHHALPRHFAVQLPARVEMNLGEDARRFRGFDGEAAAGVVEV